MVDPYIAEIRIFAGNFAPEDWAKCEGQIMNISQNTALFALLGTAYGGNGQTTYALPDLRGRAPMHFGQGPGLSDRIQGEMGGSATVTLTTAEIPSHSHGVVAIDDPATDNDLENRQFAIPNQNIYTTTLTPTVALQQAIQPAGSGQPHNNMQPYLTMNFIICMFGVFPPRS